MWRRSPYPLHRAAVRAAAMPTLRTFCWYCAAPHSRHTKAALCWCKKRQQRKSNTSVQGTPPLEARGRSTPPTHPHPPPPVCVLMMCLFVCDFHCTLFSCSSGPGVLVCEPPERDWLFSLDNQLVKVLINSGTAQTLAVAPFLRQRTGTLDSQLLSSHRLLHLSAAAHPPHLRLPTPKTKHAHWHANQWETISHRLCSPLLTPLSFQHWCHTVCKHKANDRIWQSCYSGAAGILIDAELSGGIDSAGWESMKLALVKTKEKRSGVGGL